MDFFDVGSTLVDEHLVFEHVFRDIAELTGKDYENVSQCLETLSATYKIGIIANQSLGTELIMILFRQKGLV